jgi:hypothetical protein
LQWGLFLTASQPAGEPGISYIQVSYRNFSAGLPVSGEVSSIMIGDSAPSDSSPLTCNFGSGTLDVGTKLYDTPIEIKCTHKPNADSALGFQGGTVQITVKNELPRHVVLGGIKSYPLNWEVLYPAIDKNNRPIKNHYSCYLPSHDPSQYGNLEARDCYGDCERTGHDDFLKGRCTLEIGAYARVGHGSPQVQPILDYSFKTPKKDSVDCLEGTTPRGTLEAAAREDFRTLSAASLRGYCAARFPPVVP